MLKIYTIGHSTHSIEDFIEMLKVNNIKQLVDIRTIPKSRYNPQFGEEELKKSLEKENIKYVYMKDLGGLRPKSKDSINLGWRNLSFRNYADYMQTDEFKKALEELITISKKEITAIMCAEAVPWRCHRSLVGDALTVKKVEVLDIFSKTSTKEHTLTSFAKVEGDNIVYPQKYYIKN